MPTKNDGWKISVVGSAMARAAGKNLPNDNAWLLAAYNAVEADLTPLPVAPKAEPLHVGDSDFEVWFSTKDMKNLGTKQLARDAYAAGMSDPLVAPQPVVADTLTDAEIHAVADSIPGWYDGHDGPSFDQVAAFARAIFDLASPPRAIPAEQAAPTEPSEYDDRDRERLDRQAAAYWREFDGLAAHPHEASAEATVEQIGRIQDDMRSRNWDVSRLHIWQVLDTAKRLSEQAAAAEPGNKP